MHKTSSLTAAAVLLLPCLCLPNLACQNKAKLDVYVAGLRTAAETNNYQAFVAIAHPELPAKFSKAAFESVSKALAKMGPFKERSMTGIKVKAGGPASGTYNLAYEKGVVKLEIAVFRGKIVRFKFSGPAFKKALNAVRFGVFKVARFEFLESKGGKKKKSNVYKMGQTVYWRMIVFGMKEKNGHLWGKASAKIEADGETIYNKPNFLDTKAPLKKGDPPVFTLNGFFKLRRVGAYKMSFKITDVNGGKTLDHRQMVAIEK